MASYNFSSRLNESKFDFDDEAIRGNTSQDGCQFRNDATSTQTLRVVVYCVIIAVSIFGNCMTIAVVRRNKNMRKALDFFIVNLALTDLTITCVYMPRVIVMWLRGSAWLVEGVFGAILCKVVPFLHGISIIVSILTLMALAVDRFIAIVYPLRQRITARTSKFIIAFTWILAAMVRFPYLYSLKLVYKTREDEFSCDADMKRAFGINQAREIYYTFLFVAFYGVPFVIITASYVKILVALRRQQAFREDIADQAKDSARSKVVRETRDRASKKVLYMLLSVTAAFVFCWLPYFVAQIVFDVIPCLLRFWRLFLAHSNSALNPCLYAVFNEKYRRGYRRILSLFCCERV